MLIRILNYTSLIRRLDGTASGCLGRLAPRFYSSFSKEKYSSKDIRNIGIMAHIDAGKTTLAESLLFTSKAISKMGSVNDGTTQFDYMEQEIKRGITIRSACSSFNWKSYHINLVDTPGHTDFSGELHRALEVIDGCILVVDGTKGIQAQTKHIYSSLPKSMPRILFINKVDVLGVSIDYNLKSIKKYLTSDFVLIENPDLLFGENPDMKDQRISHIIEYMANLDEEIADFYLSDKVIPNQLVLKRLRERVQNAKITPIVSGSALKSLGTNDLLTVVCELFPSPGSVKLDEDSTTLYAFKTIPDKLPIVNAFCKVISGTLDPNTRLFNATISKPGSFKGIYKIHGNNFTECQRLITGDIGMIAGMSHTRTGHVLSTNPKTNIAIKYKDSSSDLAKASNCVCFAAINAKDDSQTSKLVQAIDCIKIEDPGLIYKYDPDAADSIIVGGFGEFHFEILAELLRDNYGIDVKIGTATIAYKETPAETFSAALFLDDKPQDKTHIGLELIMEPLEQSHVFDTCSFDLVSNSANRSQRCIVVVDDKAYKEHSRVPLSSDEGQVILSHVKELLLNSLSSGPVLGAGMISTKITISRIKIYSTSTIAGAKFVASRVLRSIYEKGVFTVLEPIMSITVYTPNEFIGPVTRDLRNNRNATIIDTIVDQTNGNTQASIIATAPLKGMLGYTKTIRSLTRGNGTFTMIPNGYEPTN